MDRKEAAVDRIVRAARARFAAEGYQNTSTETLLQDLGISRGALYHHFKSKEDLFAAVLEAVEAEVAAATIQAAKKYTDPREALVAGFNAFLVLASSEEVKQIVLLDAPSVVGWKKWRALEERYALGAVKQALSAIASQGRLDTELVDVLAHVLLASLVELALLIAYSADPKRSLRLGRRAIKQVLVSLTHESAIGRHPIRR